MKILMEKQYSLYETIIRIYALLNNAPMDDNRGYLYSDLLSWRMKDIVDVYASTHDPSHSLRQSIQFMEYNSDNDEFDYKDYVPRMLNEFMNRYADYYAISISNDEVDPSSKELLDFLFKFWNALNVTYPKYATIIKFYTNNEAKLMDALNRDYTDDADSSGTVVNRYNDTPQDGGAFEDDNHTTNINESTSSSDSGLEHKETYNTEYMIDRINKIRDNLSNLYTEWENKVATILWR